MMGCHAKGRGFQLMQRAAELPGVEIAAVCDVDARARQDASDRVFAMTGVRPKMLVDFREAPFEQAHAVQDDASVHLELCLARSSQTYRAFAAAAARAAALSLEVRPEALQARQHVAILSQLDLRLGVGRLCPHGEDVEDERRAVEYLDLQLVLDVAKLLGGEFVVEDDHVGPRFVLAFGVEEVVQLLEFSPSQVRDARRPVGALREAAHGLGARRLGQKLQFVKILFCLCLVLMRRYQSNQYRRLSLCLRDYKFLHSLQS